MTPYLLVLAVLLGIAPALIAHGKGRNFLLWWIYGVLLGPVALLHAILLRRHVVPSPFAASPARPRRWRSHWPAFLWAATSVAIAIVAVTVYGVLAPEDFGLRDTGTRVAKPADRTPETQTATETTPTPPLTQTTRQEPAPTVRVTLRHEPPQESKAEEPKAEEQKAEKQEKLARAPTMPVERMVSADSVAPGSTLERTTPREPAKTAPAKTEPAKPEEAQVAAAERTAPAEPATPSIPSPPQASTTPKVAAVAPTAPAAKPTATPAPQIAPPPAVEPRAAKPPKSEPKASAPKPAPTSVTAVGETVQAVQLALAKRGYDPGPAHGRAGKKTQAAIRKFQADRQLKPTGAIDYALLEALGIVGPRVHAFRPPPGMTVGR